jgi:cytochrome c-type biogenesis protein
VIAQITSLSLSAVGLAFAAGLLSFISPCVLPLVPVYLSYVSGVSVERLGRERRRLLLVSLLFVAGFTAVFVLFGAGAGGIGRLLAQHRHELAIVAGAFIAFSGLVVAGVIRLPERAVSLAPRAGGPGGAVLTGAALAIGWTPCVGYVLGAILSMAATSSSAVSGALLLLVYSLGLGVPFVLAALAFDWLMARLAAVKRHYRAVQTSAGVILVIVGVLLMFGVFSHLSRWLPTFSPAGL